MINRKEIYRNIGTTDVVAIFQVTDDENGVWLEILCNGVFLAKGFSVKELIDKTEQYFLTTNITEMLKDHFNIRLTALQVGNIYEELAREVVKKKGLYNQDNNPLEWLSIITRKLGGAANYANEYHFNKSDDAGRYVSETKNALMNYRNELIQLAGIVIRAVDCLDRDEWGDLTHVCRGKCGMSYCDENGCTERKRIEVEPTVYEKTPPQNITSEIKNCI